MHEDAMDITYCWKDLASSGGCCPALHESANSYIVTGSEAGADIRRQLHYLASDEGVVVTPKPVLDLLIVDDAVRREATFDLSNDRAERYERLASTYMLPWASDLVIQAGIQPGDRVLDLGCGSGFVGRMVKADDGKEVFVAGVDRDPAMAFLALKLSGADEIYREDASSMSIKSGTFDKVLCQQALQYFDDVDRCLDEIYRILEPGGKFLTSVWAPFDENRLLEAQVGCVSKYLRTATIDDILSRNTDSLGGVTGISNLLDSHGFIGIDLKWRDRVISFDSFEAYFSLLLENSTWGHLFRDSLTRGQRAEVVDYVRDAFDWQNEKPLAKMRSLVAECQKPT